MRTRTKVWLIIAASLVLIGCILFAGVMSKLKWDFTKLSTVKYEMNAYEISEAFDDISINTDTEDITFMLSNDEICRVECHAEESEKHLVTVKDNTLVIESTPRDNWYDYIGISLGESRITVYLPKTEYASLSINESTGDIEIPKDYIFNGVVIALTSIQQEFSRLYRR